jgi:hypothetical protein
MLIELAHHKLRYDSLHSFLVKIDNSSLPRPVAGIPPGGRFHSLALV